MSINMRLVSLSLSDILNMTLIGDESFYRCEVVDAEFAASDAKIATLQALGDELAALLEEARNERDQYKQQRADWKAAYEGLLERSASTRFEANKGE